MRGFRFAGGSLPPAGRPCIMGILNVTPDSFYDGGRYFDPARAAERAAEMEAEGADMIDVGAQSTRPGAKRATQKQELERLRAALPLIRKATSLPISVDTYRPAVARWCLAHGAAVINDVSGVFSPEMAAVVADFGAGWVLMHAGPPGAATADEVAYPEGVEWDVQRFFDEMRAETAACGVQGTHICLDPGFGFAKTNEQNERLLAALGSLNTGGSALLVGLSRKRFVRAAAAGETDADILAATVRKNLQAAAAGADILRVHDVAAHVAALRDFSE